VNNPALSATAGAGFRWNRRREEGGWIAQESGKSHKIASWQFSTIFVLNQYFAFILADPR
jgi:hypothetical protein